MTRLEELDIIIPALKIKIKNKSDNLCLYVTHEYILKLNDEIFNLSVDLKNSLKEFEELKNK